VWALRRDVAGTAPQFLGAATLGLARPDIAQVFGAHFDAAGFQLLVLRFHQASTT
jgi:hypothetical protein